MAHVGFHPQRQDGRQYVGVVLPVGRMTSDQVRGLSEIAETYGSGELRFAVWQNVLIPNIADHDVDDVKRELELLGLGYEASSVRAGLVACTGSAGCKFAAADTKANAMVIAEALEKQFRLDQPLNIHLAGCHHSGAQHYIGDIGLLGCKVEKGEEMVDGYHVHLGGERGQRQGIARLLFESVAFDDIPPLLAAIIGSYLENRHSEESFVRFAARHSDGELRAMVNVAT